MANPFKRTPVDPTNCSLVEFAWARSGSMLKAARVVAFITAWEATRRELGRTPTIEEYADHWRENRATAYRHQALFREVFDLADTPDVILDALAARRRTVTDRLDWPALTTAGAAA